ncbi:hypothetical protein [Saccharothrix sp. NRRL B-16348]|uniref:hypothetical protein n=1 Tax=Saccharothrix sp. NRRL B-16348 TaxID=1415542 RepID=UPI0006AEF6E7|nr:hypothetical protein [Saccharothrix sp. NRRL B-16348]
MNPSDDTTTEQTAHHLHRVLGSVPGSSHLVTVSLAAALCDDEATARAALDALTDTGRAKPYGTHHGNPDDRYQLLYPGQPPRTGYRPSATDIEDWKKVITWHADRAADAAHVLAPRTWWAHPQRHAATPAQTSEARSGAERWFDEHRMDLRVMLWTAVEHRWAEPGRDLAETLACLADATGLHHDAVDFADAGLRLTDRRPAIEATVLHARLVTALSELGDHDAARRAAESVARFAEHDTTDPSTAAQAWRVLARAAGKADALDDRIGYLLKALNAAALGADTSLRASLHTVLREAVEAKLGVNASAIHSLLNHRSTPPPPSGHRDERPHDAANRTAE